MIKRFFLMVLTLTCLTSCTIFEEVKIATIDNKPCFYMPEAIGYAKSHEPFISVEITSTSTQESSGGYKTDWKAYGKEFSNAPVPVAKNSCIQYKGEDLEENRVYRTFFEVYSARGVAGFCVHQDREAGTIRILNADSTGCSSIEYSADGDLPFWFVNKRKLILCSAVLCAYFLYRIVRRSKARI